MYIACTIYSSLIYIHNWPLQPFSQDYGPAPFLMPLILSSTVFSVSMYNMGANVQSYLAPVIVLKALLILLI